MAELTLEAQALLVAQGMLRRLPPSLWDQGLDTTQGKVYKAIATELARWLQHFSVVRQCTLLQEADGNDLDFLLRDYALKRYNQRPDDYARQIARQILWTPKGTLYALQEVVRLLVDAPQLLGRSGRHQPHWWVAMMQPVVMPRTYWQLADMLGGCWYVSVRENALTLSSSPPPGANMTPWPDGYTPIPQGPPPFAGGWEDVQTLHWCTVDDPTNTPWYLTVGNGGSLRLADTQPTQRPGTTQPLQLLDGEGEAWGVQVQQAGPTLTVVPLTTPLQVPSYWRLKDSNNAIWIVCVQSGALHTLPAPAPLGWQDTTPGGVPLDWVGLPF